MSAPVPWIERLSLALLPAVCLLCREPGAHGRDLCGPCHAALPWNVPACPRCALPLPAGAGACGACQARAPPWDRAHAALVYGEPLDRLLPRFKFHGDLAAGRLLSQLLRMSVEGLPRPAALLPLPLHRSRLRRRGYDQALELARPLARALGLPPPSGGLRRQRATAPQTELDAAARRRNVRGAFVAGPGPWPAHVALVDDVMTTGASLADATRALREAGVARVDVWVVARAPPPR